MKILLLELGWIGDTVVTLPAIRALKQAFPEAKLIRVCTSVAEPIVTRCPYVDEILIYEREHEHKGLWGGWRLLKELRKIRPDIFMNLHVPDINRNFKIYFRDNLFSFLTGAKTRVAYFSFGTGAFLTHGIRAEKRHLDKYIVDLINNLVSLLGAKPDRELELWISDQDREEARTFLKKYQIEETDSLVAVHPGAKRPSRRWPEVRFADMVRWLSRDFRVVITGTKEERPLATYIKDTVPEAIVASGTLSLMGTAALLERCRLFITNDTGIMHMAFALKVPTVALFGPGRVKRWVPPNASWIKPLHHPVPCSPCYKWSCEDLTCLKAITVEEVKEAVSRLISQGSCSGA